MKRSEYEKICRATFGGEEHTVENRSLHEKGIVFNCKADTFNVRVGTEIRQWGRRVCEESEEGSDAPVGKEQRRRPAPNG